MCVQASGLVRFQAGKQEAGSDGGLAEGSPFHFLPWSTIKLDPLKGLDTRFNVKIATKGHSEKVIGWFLAAND